MAAYDQHLERQLARAAEALTYETRSPALWKTLERLATVVMKAEQAAGRVRGFAVRCDDSLNPPEAEELTVEVSYLPPAPRAKAVVVHLRARNA